MNIAQLRAVLKAGEKLHRAAGDENAASALSAFSNLLDESESISVADFVKRIEKARKQKMQARRPPPRRRKSRKRES